MKATIDLQQILNEHADTLKSFMDVGSFGIGNDCLFVYLNRPNYLLQEYLKRLFTNIPLVIRIMGPVTAEPARPTRDKNVWSDDLQSNLEAGIYSWLNIKARIEQGSPYHETDVLRASENINALLEEGLSIDKHGNGRAICLAVANIIMDKNREIA